jgi:arginase
MGPSALRVAGLVGAIERLGHRVVDRGDLLIPSPETEPAGQPKAKYLPLVARTCTALATQVEQVMVEGGFPLVLGGDHSIAIGTVSGLSAFLRRTSGAQPRSPEVGPSSRLGLIWFDAHGDINTPGTSPSGNIHGMPVACLLGHGDSPRELCAIGGEGPKVHPARFAQIGLRDLDEVEKRHLRETGIHAFTMADIDKRGMAAVMEEALGLATRGTDLLHVSFDIDAIDPAAAPGTGTPKHGGLTYREAHLALEMIAESGKLSSLEMVEVNPILDLRNQTAELAVELIGSALGKRII